MSVIQLYPPTAPAAYKTARDDLLAAEIALRNQIETVAAQRRALPTGAVMGPYTLTDAATGAAVPLSSLIPADGAHSLAIYHMMFTSDAAAPCEMCAALVDGLDGIAAHVAASGVRFVVVARAPAAQIAAYAARRGWRGLRFLSSDGTSFNRDMGVEIKGEDGDWMQMPALSVFRAAPEGGPDGKVRHVYTQSAPLADGVLRGLDSLAPLWGLMDFLPEGRGENWYPANEYMEDGKGK